MERSEVVNDGKSVGWVPADLSLNAFGGIDDDNPFGSLGDLRLVADLSTEVLLPGIGGEPLSIFLANQVLPDGTPWECCPRTHAMNSLHQLHSEFGIELVASFEHEFVLLGGPSGGSPFGLDSYRMAEPFGSDLLSVLRRNGIDPENWLAEYGSNQFEITVKPSSALVAADRAVLLREIVRDTARRHGYRASFTPLPRVDAVGNGVHVHLSIVKDGKPVTFNPGQPGNLSLLASQAFAGILRHAPALQAWTAPSQVSSLRLKPHRWSAGGVYAAVQDREALLRICPITTVNGANPAASFNVEYRAADATANPWLVISVLARAMISGLRYGKSIERIWNGQSPSEADSIALLPSNLEAAIAAFESDGEVQSWFAPDLSDAHLGIRRSEARYLDGLTDDEKCERYLGVY